MLEKNEGDLHDLPLVSKEGILQWLTFWQQREKEEGIIPGTAGMALATCDLVIRCGFEM